MPAITTKTKADQLLSSVAELIELSAGIKLRAPGPKGKPFSLFVLHPDGVQGRAIAENGARYNFVVRGERVNVTPHQPANLDSALATILSSDTTQFPDVLGLDLYSAGLIHSMRQDDGKPCGDGYIAKDLECNKDERSTLGETPILERQRRRVDRQARDISKAAGDIYDNSEGAERAAFASAVASAATVVAIAGVGYYFLGPGKDRTLTPRTAPEPNQSKAQPAAAAAPEASVSKESSPAPATKKTSASSEGALFTEGELGAIADIKGTGQKSAVKLAAMVRGKADSPEDMTKAGINKPVGLRRSAAGLANLKDDLWEEAKNEDRWGGGWNGNTYAVLGSAPKEIQGEIKTMLDESPYFGDAAPNGFSPKTYMGYVMESAAPGVKLKELEHRAAVASHVMRNMKTSQREKLAKGGPTLFAYQEKLERHSRSIAAAKTKQQREKVLKQAIADILEG